MSISLNFGEARDTQSKGESLQFIVGQDEAGNWIALESRGRGGGIFINRQAALNYAAFESRQRADAVRCSNVPLRLWS